MAAADLSWVPMDLDEQAEYERRANRAHLVRRGGVWWRRMRPLFYRPLNLFQELQVPADPPPVARWLGAVQFPVAHVHATGKIQLLVCPGLSSYSLEGLSSSMRSQIRKAGRNFRVEVIADREQFVRLAYPVYLEFQSRTRYGVNRFRETEEGFRSWSEALFNLGKARILGAFTETGLAAVLVTFRVQDILFYSVYFGNQQALERGAADWLLHTVKMAAGADPGIRMIFSAVAGMPRGLDRFYLLRGFQLLDRPTTVVGNPLTLNCLRLLMPRMHRKLVGHPRDDAGGVSAGRSQSRTEVA